MSRNKLIDYFTLLLIVGVLIGLKTVIFDFQQGLDQPISEIESTAKSVLRTRWDFAKFVGPRR